jgi:acyl phosphate:glycerol-3-phosphate acyltransferase
MVGSLVVGRFRGVDIRKLGSGNAGGTNALRTQGKAFALAVVLIDVLKVVLPVLWLTGATLPGSALDPSVSRETVAVAIAAGAVLGHVWPLFFGFRGGKGMATLLGAYGAIQWTLLAPVVLVWVADRCCCAVTSGSRPWWRPRRRRHGWRSPGRPAGRCSGLRWRWRLFVAWTHRGNIARMRAGTESRMFRGLAGRGR